MEIKSAGTFSMNFVKGLTRFQALGLKRVTTGMVLYSGEQRFVVHGVNILNPLLAENLWETLTSPVKQEHS